MQYSLTKIGPNLSELKITFEEEDFDAHHSKHELLEEPEHRNIQLWFEYKAKIVHDILKTFLETDYINIDITDHLFDCINFKELDGRLHYVSFDECPEGECELKNEMEKAWIKYELDVDIMLEMAGVC